MSSRSRTLLGGTSALAALVIGASFMAVTPARAQTAPAASSGPDITDEVTTTARRKEERIQTVPIAITAFSAAGLQARSIENLVDLQHAVPSFTYGPTQRSGIGSDPTIRGLPGVITYFAEVPLIQGNQIGDYQAFDNSVQVLKGPQGTLFGQNTTGGAILLDPVKPTNNFEGYAAAMFGSSSWEQFEGVLNVPIVEDKLLVRIGGKHDQRDGFTTVANTPYAGKFAGLDLDNRDSWYGRVSVTFRPTDDIENYLIADETYVHTNGTALILDQLNFDPAFKGSTVNYILNQPTYAPASPSYFLALQKSLGVRQIVGFTPTIVLPGTNKQVTYDFAGPIEKAQNYDIIDILKWDVTDDITIKNILGYVNSRELTRSNFTDTPIISQGFVSPRGWNNSSVGAGGGVGLTTQYTEELQANGKALGGALSYTVGGFLMYRSIGPGDGTITTGTNQLPSQILVSTGGGGDARTQALYSQGNYDIGSLWDALDGLKFTGGFRYNWDWASQYQHIRIPNILLLGDQNPPICASGTKASHCDVAHGGHFHSPGWNLTLDYQLDPETMIYVSSSKGYRAGGFTPGAATEADQVYQPETLVNVEVGIKSDWNLMGIHAHTNVDAYHGFYSNIQEGVVATVLICTKPGVPSSCTPSNFGVTENAAEATAEGIEFEGAVYPVKGLELHTADSFNHNVFDSFSSATFGQLAGRSFTGFPKLKLAAGAVYHLPIDEAWGDVAVKADWYYQTHYLTNTDNGPGSAPTHHLINVGVDWTNVYGQPIDLSFFMTNVTDATFVLGNFALYAQQGFVSKVYNEPQEWGFRLKYRFEPDSTPEAAPAAYTPPPVVAPAPAVAHSYMVFFDFDKSDLTSDATAIVDQAAKNAGPAKATEISVTGHTDTVGSDAYNMRLSKRRAESVAAQLEKDGIPSSEIAIVAKGKRDLLVPTKDGVREPQNRRVTIVYGGATS
jgi:iron complex outermembrane receptor protein